MIPPQTAAETAQSLKLRLAESPPDNPNPIILVESHADLSVFGRLLHDNVFTVPAFGKPNVLEIRDLLAGEAFSDRLVYLVDCDNLDRRDILGLPDVVVSVNNDIESDLLWHLDSLQEFFASVFGYEYDHPGEARRAAEDLRSRAAEVAANLGQILTAARSCSISVRVTDQTTGQRRRIRVHDLAAFESWVYVQPTMDELASAVAAQLEWTMEQQDAIRAEMASRATKPCRLHSLPGCDLCRVRTYANGHEQFSFIIQSLRDRPGPDLSPKTLDVFLRATVDRSRSLQWSVGMRLRRWEDLTGYRLLR